MTDRDERRRRGGRPPRRPSFLRKLVVFVVIVAAGGGGYLAWRYRQRTGEIDLDRERWKDVVSDEVDGAKSGIRKAKRAIKDVSVRAVADARELLASVEAWLKEKNVSPASREELEDADQRYAREFGGGTPAGAPAGDATAPGADEAPPAGGTAGTAPSRAATGRAAESLARGREEFRTGLEHWRAAGEPGSEREQEELALARDRFTSAQEHLTRAQEGAPDDPEIEKLLVDTNRFLYDCLKRLKVDARGGE